MKPGSPYHSFSLSLISLCLLLMTACSADAPRIAFEELDFALADAGSGEKLFNQSNNEAPACAACHSITGESSSIGNSLAGIAATAAERVAGQSAEEYLYWSILRPGRHLVAGYSNIMYAGYEDSLEAADVADLVAYLLSL
ncbi:MAG: c-type cytochrome [Chloroflexota bacterium]|nr:c-type cytochrome [Chloroflexota bacterium]MDE2910422.1 c-type cytochrome [Chloroflexota bacterium]